MMDAEIVGTSMSLCGNEITHYKKGDYISFKSSDCQRAFKELTETEPETAVDWITYYPSLKETIDHAFALIEFDFQFMLQAARFKMELENGF